MNYQTALLNLLLHFWPKCGHVNNRWIHLGVKWKPHFTEVIHINHVFLLANTSVYHFFSQQALLGSSLTLVIKYLVFYVLFVHYRIPPLEPNAIIPLDISLQLVLLQFGTRYPTKLFQPSANSLPLFTRRLRSVDLSGYLIGKW